MARKCPQGNPLPVGVYWKHGSYWLVKQNKWHALGKHYAQAMSRFGRMVSPSHGFSALVDRALEAHAKLPTKRGKVPSKNTMRQYRMAATRIKEVFAEFDPSEIKASDVQHFYDHDLALHPGAANNCLSVLKIVLAYGLKWGMVEHNAAVSVKSATMAKRKRYLEDWEFAAIQKNASPWLAVAMDILFLTAQRIGDVLKLKVSDCTDEGVRFQQQKGDAKLTVEWTPELRDAVERARRLHGNVLSPFLFRPVGKGKPYTYAAALSAWNRACKACGVQDATIHDIRARSLTIAKRQGLDATALAGHADAKMTERYIRKYESVVVKGPRSLRQN